MTPKCSQEPLKTLPRGSQDAPRGFQDALKTLQEAPQTPLRRLKMLLRVLKSLPRRSKTLQEPPKTLQEPPKTLQDTPKRPSSVQVFHLARVHQKNRVPENCHSSPRIQSYAMISKWRGVRWSAPSIFRGPQAPAHP